MTETHHGAVVRYYSELVEVRPHSRFTSSPSEREANAGWLARAVAWGNSNVAGGHLITPGIDRLTSEDEA